MKRILVCVMVLALGVLATQAIGQEVPTPAQKAPAVAVAPVITVPATPVYVLPRPVYVVPRPVYVVPRPVMVVPPYVTPLKPNFGTPIRDKIWRHKIKKQEKKYYRQFPLYPIVVAQPI